MLNTRTGYIHLNECKPTQIQANIIEILWQNKSHSYKHYNSALLHASLQESRRTEYPHRHKITILVQNVVIPQKYAIEQICSLVNTTGDYYMITG